MTVRKYGKRPTARASGRAPRTPTASAGKGSSKHFWACGDCQAHLAKNAP